MTNFSSSFSTISLDNIDTIKECMKNINLPIPDWASTIPESSISEKLTNFIYKRLEQANK